MQGLCTIIMFQQRKQKALEESRNRAEITEQMPHEPEEEDDEKDELEEDIVVTKL